MELLIKGDIYNR